MRKLLILVLQLFGLSMGLCATDDTLPLKSAAPDGLGPLNVPSLTWRIAGTSALNTDNPQPDIFLAARGLPPVLYYIPWVRTTPEGTPVFGKPEKIAAPPAPAPSPHREHLPFFTIFQTKDRVTHALAVSEKKITHSTLNHETLEFENPSTFSVSSLPSNIRSLAVVENPDGSFELILELTGYSPPSRANSFSIPRAAMRPEWRPYDAAGITTYWPAYSCLYAARISSLPKGRVTKVRLLSPTKAEVPFYMSQITPVTLDPKQPRSVVTGSNEGVFYYYPNSSADSLATKTKLHVAGPDGNILRLPQIHSSLTAYPDIKTGLPTHFFAAGEGPLYFYKFTGDFAKNGNPIYEKPTPVLQTNANLHTSTLPSISTIDWDSDGILDIIVANSDGLILFFKNIGDNENPAFLPGVRLQTKNGFDIRISGEYKGSVQTIHEANFGYLSVTPVDWSGNGVPDLITGDITGNYYIYLNTGTPGNPQLESRQPLYCNGIPLHGAWRCQPAIARIGERVIMAIVDDEHQFHLYERIDNHNIADLGKLRMENGDPINTQYIQIGGRTGRTKLAFCDANGDGQLDLVIGTCGSAAIPNIKNGIPAPSFGTSTSGIPLLMLNKGNNEKFSLSFPMPFCHKKNGIIQTAGWHERGAILTPLGAKPGQLSLLTTNEYGNIFLYRPENITARPHDYIGGFINPKPPLRISGPNAPFTPVTLTSPVGNDFTIAFFFSVDDERLLSTDEKWGAVHPMTLAHLHTEDKTQQFIIRLNQNKIIHQATDDGTTWVNIFVPAIIKPHTTYHLAIVRKNNRTSVYINGQIVHTSYSQAATPGLNTLYYGRSGKRFLIGAMSTPAIYPFSVSPKEIQMLATQ